MGAFESIIAAAIPLAVVLAISGSFVSGAVQATELPLAAAIWLVTKPMRRQRKYKRNVKHAALQKAAEAGRQVRPEDYEDARRLYC